jgi:hypothetical protein
MLQRRIHQINHLSHINFHTNVYITKIILENSTENEIMDLEFRNFHQGQSIFPRKVNYAIAWKGNACREN